MPRSDMDLVISAEWDAWVDGFEDLASGPSQQMEDEWRAAGDALFDAADSIVHVVSGVLKASGSMSVDRSGSTLEAVLLYDADYAVYEHERGGSHSWIDLAYAATEDEFQDALVRGWLRTVRSWR